jgi:hypothetical protein
MSLDISKESKGNLNFYKKCISYYIDYFNNFILKDSDARNAIKTYKAGYTDESLYQNEILLKYINIDLKEILEIVNDYGITKLFNKTKKQAKYQSLISYEMKKELLEYLNKNINNYPQLSSKYKQGVNLIKKMDKIISDSPSRNEDIYVYRGGLDITSELKCINNEFYYKNEHYLSTTPILSIAFGFFLLYFKRKPYALYKIKIPGKFKCIPVPYIDTFENNVFRDSDTQYEILIHRNSVFKIIKHELIEIELDNKTINYYKGLIKFTPCISKIKYNYYELELIKQDSLATLKRGYPKLENIKINEIDILSSLKL